MEWPVMIGDWSAAKSVNWVAFIVAGRSGAFRLEVRTPELGQDNLPIAFDADEGVGREAIGHRKAAARDRRGRVMFGIRGVRPKSRLKSWPASAPES